MNRRDYIIIFLLLLPFFIALPWGLNRNAQLNKEKANSARLATTVEELQSTNERLDAKVIALDEAYSSLEASNQSLEDSLAAKGTTVITRYLPAPASALTASEQELQATIGNLQAQNEILQDTVSNLRTRNKKIKDSNLTLNTELAAVKKENQSLRGENLRLVKLNQRMQDQLDRTALESARATGFQVKLLRDDNGKLTSKASKIKQLQISFNLNEVPEKYRFEQPVYVVVTDRSGTPLVGENPIKAKVNINNSMVELLALEARDVELGVRQHLSFTQYLTKKLTPGEYRVQVFIKQGLLGAASFVAE